jgi:hypothetical protein
MARAGWVIVPALAFTHGMSDCFPTLSCDEFDDVCTAKGLAAAGLTAEALNEDMLVRDCAATIDGCSFGADLCPELALLIKSARAQAAACSKKAPCNGYDACLRAILGGPERKSTD